MHGRRRCWGRSRTPAQVAHANGGQTLGPRLPACTASQPCGQPWQLRHNQLMPRRAGRYSQASRHVAWHVRGCVPSPVPARLPRRLPAACRQGPPRPRGQQRVRGRQLPGGGRRQRGAGPGLAGRCTALLQPRRLPRPTVGGRLAATGLVAARRRRVRLGLSSCAVLRRYGAAGAQGRGAGGEAEQGRGHGSGRWLAGARAGSQELVDARAACAKQWR